MPLDRLRPTPTVFRRLALAVVVLTVVVTAAGAFVRLSKSGLGCADWPICDRDQPLPAADDTTALIEFGNRMLSGLLGVPIVLLVLASIRRRPFRRDLLGWSLGLLAGVLAEAVLGAIVVRFHLKPAAVIGHFLLAMVLLWAALVLQHRVRESAGGEALARRATLLVSTRAHAMAWLAAGACAAAMVAGTFATGAGPHGGDTRAERLPFAITSVVRVHSLLAWCSLLLLVVTLWTLYRSGASAELRRRAAWVTGAVIVQGGIGYAQYALGVPPGLVGIHVFGSTIVWICAVRLVLGCSTRLPVADDTPIPGTVMVPVDRSAEPAATPLAKVGP